MTLADKILSSFQQKKSLNPEIWTLDTNNEYRLRKEIRDKLLLAANDFLDCNYNWSKFSDIDLHLLLDYEEIDENTSLVQNILNTKKNLWNASHHILIKGYEVEVYVQDVNEVHHSSGVYSVLFNKWIIQPTKANKNIDFNKVLEKSLGLSIK